jgi:flavin reductase (DIM6/NTAB) family NADH-FMN oxidoreductase RutF
VNAEQIFDALMSDVDPPMVVVTTAACDERSGCLVGFASQCSIDPPRYMAFLSKANHTFGVACRAELLAVHLLSQDHLHLAELFGALTGDEVDKFARCRWHPGPTGIPLLDDVGTWFVGRILEQVDAGDHVGFLLSPVEARHDRPVDQLGLQAVRNLEAGHPA